MSSALPGLSVESHCDGQVAVLRMAHGKGNVLDATLVGSLRTALSEQVAPQLKLVVFAAEGRHFSFGASVEEHLPGKVGDMLGGFHALFRELEALGVPTCALVSGACLGGGFELAIWCGRVFVTPTAKLGVPEVTLGVFPPIAALGLRWRTGGNVATELVTTGRQVGGEEAVALGVADACVHDLDGAWRAWFDRHLAALSAPAVRFAWRASRRPMQRALGEELDALERLYLDELMACIDPAEGLNAFLERRPPTWSHR